MFYSKPEDPLERQRFVRPLSPKSLAMTKYILNELSDTERTYNQLLKLIQNVSFIDIVLYLIVIDLNNNNRGT
jgi:hypothetical protein